MIYANNRAISRFEKRFIYDPDGSARQTFRERAPPSRRGKISKLHRERRNSGASFASLLRELTEVKELQVFVAARRREVLAKFHFFQFKELGSLGKRSTLS